MNGKFVGILFLLSFTVCAQKPSLDEIRLLYQEAESGKAAAEELEELLEPYNEDAPVLLAYKASGTMFMAKHVINPFSKMSYFKKGKELFQRAVDADQEELEIRFLRFAVQSTAPGFLGYNKHIRKDKTFLLNELPEIKDRNLKTLILPFLQNSDQLTETEKKQISRTKS